jgi:hypothetical protein
MIRIPSDLLLKPPEALANVAVATTPPKVRVHIIPDLPTDGGEQWLSTADGCLADNGRFYTGIGNTLDGIGGQGQSRIYEYDPVGDRLRLFANLRDTLTDPMLCAGKLHSRFDRGRDGKCYLAVHFGVHPTEEDFAAGFKGSSVVAFDPNSGKVEIVGVPIPGEGIPASHLDPQHMLFYMFTTPGREFVVYDVLARVVKFRGLHGSICGLRHILLGADGNAYISVRPGYMARYRPDTNSIDTTPAHLPVNPQHTDPLNVRNSLRASSRVVSDGTVYGMTTEGMMFLFDPKKETILNLGPNIGVGVYSSSLELSPDEKYLYYAVTGSEGAGEYGVPIVQYKIATGRRKVLAFLGRAVHEAREYHLSKTFNMRLSPDGGTLFFTYNGSPAAADGQVQEDFGQPSVVTVQIPLSERL